MRILLKHLFFTLALLVSWPLIGQNTNNPFELQHRLPKPEKGEGGKTTTDTRLIKTNNPFDIAEKPVIKAITPKPDNQDIPKETSKKGNLFWLFFILLAFFTTVVALTRKKLEQSYQAVFNDNYLRQLHRANQGNFSLGYLLLYILFFLNLGIFIFLAANNFSAGLPENFGTILLTCLGVGLVFLFKHALLFFVQNVFPISKEIKLYSFSIMLFSIILGIVLLPINLTAAFATENLAQTAIWIGLGAILVTYLYRSLRGLSVGSKYIMLHTFHFLLYLCAVEILPIIVLIKFIMLRIH